jgi:hypothetical protein
MKRALYSLGLGSSLALLIWFMPNHFDPRSKSWMFLFDAKMYPGIFFAMQFQWSRTSALAVLLLANCVFYSGAMLILGEILTFMRRRRSLHSS